jgi:glutaredoxin 3
MVFAKSYGGFCQRTRMPLTTMEQNMNVDLDLLPNSDGEIIQAHLKAVSGQGTVPIIFIGKQHVGGNSDLRILHREGKLHGMLLETSRAQTEL